MCIPHNIYGFKQASQGAMADYMIFPAKSIVHKVFLLSSIDRIEAEVERI